MRLNKHVKTILEKWVLACEIEIVLDVCDNAIIDSNTRKRTSIINGLCLNTAITMRVRVKSPRI